MHDAPIGYSRLDGLASAAYDRHLHAGSSQRFAATHHIPYRLGQQVRFLSFLLTEKKHHFSRNPQRKTKRKKKKLKRNISDSDETVWVFRTGVRYGRI